MIFVIIVTLMALIVVGAVMTNLCYEPVDVIGTVISAICTGILIVALIATVLLTVDVTHLHTIDERLAMYEEENAKIESQIVETVENYQKYETDIFIEVSPESAITLVAMYPELKSDALVQKQIEVYMANNDKIKELKEEKINSGVKRWWLYFGG